MSLKSVNPERIRGGDIISTRYGLSRVISVNEDKGILSYQFLDDNLAMNENTPSYGNNIIGGIAQGFEFPIRSASLVARYKDPEQLTFSFVQEEIDKALHERNKQLEITKLEIIQKGSLKASKVRKQKEKVTPEEKAFAEMIMKAGGLDKVLEMMGKEKG